MPKLRSNISKAVVPSKHTAGSAVILISVFYVPGIPFPCFANSILAALWVVIPPLFFFFIPPLLLMKLMGSFADQWTLSTSIWGTKPRLVTPFLPRIGCVRQDTRIDVSLNFCCLNPQSGSDDCPFRSWIVWLLIGFFEMSKILSIYYFPACVNQGLSLVIFNQRAPGSTVSTYKDG